MYAKATKTNKMNSQTNENIKGAKNFNKDGNSSSVNTKDVYNEFYYQKERNEFLRRLDLQKIFFLK